MVVLTKSRKGGSELRVRANALKRNKELYFESPALQSSGWFFLSLARSQDCAGARACGERPRLLGGRTGGSVRPWFGGCGRVCEPVCVGVSVLCYV